MKNVIFGLLLAGTLGFVFSCKKDNSATQSDQLMAQIAAASDVEVLGAEDLPADITAYVEKNHSPLTVELAFRAPSLGYQVFLEDGQQLFFTENRDCMNGGDRGRRRHGDPDHDRGHRCLAGDSIDVSTLLPAISDYVTANYAGETIASAVVKPSGKFGVALSNGVVLLFEADGTFIKECDGNPGGEPGHDGPGDGHHGGNHCLRGDSLDVTTLSAAIADYVTANYAGETITAASLKPNGWFAVELSGGKVLIFKEDGTFVRECGEHGGHGGGFGGTEITIDELPAPALDYLNANYPGVTAEVIIKTFNGKYFVRLADHTKLLFDENGNMIFDSGN